MRDASVGFHCPELRRGRRQEHPVRSHGVRRRALGQPAADLDRPDRRQRRGVPPGPRNRREQEPLARPARPVGNRPLRSHRPSRLLPGRDRTGLPGWGAAFTWVHGVADGAWWQLVTSMFTHVEIWHIGFNMLALWILGPQLEAVMGRVRFLGLYFLSGLAGSACVYWLADQQVQTVGASGAIFGLMGALLDRGDQDPRQRAGDPHVDRDQRGHHRGGQQLHLVAGPHRRLRRRAPDRAILVYAPKQSRVLLQTAGVSAVGVLVVVPDPGPHRSS